MSIPAQIQLNSTTAHTHTVALYRSTSVQPLHKQSHTYFRQSADQTSIELILKSTYYAVAALDFCRGMRCVPQSFTVLSPILSTDMYINYIYIRKQTLHGSDHDRCIYACTSLSRSGLYFEVGIFFLHFGGLGSLSQTYQAFK